MWHWLSGPLESCHLAATTRSLSSRVSMPQFLNEIAMQTQGVPLLEYKMVPGFKKNPDGDRERITFLLPPPVLSHTLKQRNAN